MSSVCATELLHGCPTKMSYLPMDSQKLSPHSLKTTLLAWSTRFGVKGSVRRGASGFPTDGQSGLTS
eukprot:2251849-Amphidinium_carterae.1